ncbi:MAG: hypothetical protein QXO16_02155 [Archaeoglobaceae archaeon]
MRFIAILVALAILIAPALALETLSSKHFSVEYAVTPEEECFTGGEKISVEYKILPKYPEYRILLGGDAPGEDRARDYTFSTELSDTSWKLVVNYYKGGTRDEGGIGKKASIKAWYFSVEGEERGIEKITANLTAIVPVCGVRLCNLTAIEATCKDCEKDALPEVKVCVANENVFKNDIKSLRARMSELEQKLKAENLYSEEDFKNVKSIIDSAESYLIARKFLDANAKLVEANNSLNQLADLTNKKIAESLYSDVDSKLSEIQKMLLNSSVLLEKLKAHSNYTQFLLEQKTLENEFSSLKDSMKSVASLMDKKEFTNAIETLKKIEANATSLNAKLANFTSLLNSEAEKLQTSWIQLPSLSLSHIAIIVAVIVAIVASLLGLKFRRRRKWDELR